MKHYHNEKSVIVKRNENIKDNRNVRQPLFIIVLLMFFVSIFFCFIFIYIVLVLNTRIKGVVSVEDNSFEILDIECIGVSYSEGAREEIIKLNSRNTKNGIGFEKTGTVYLKYKFTYTVHGEGITIYPQIYFDREEPFTPLECNVNFDFSKYGDQWNVIITYTGDGEEQKVLREDIEGNEIILY